MGNNIKAWLYDILNAIIEIESFFEGQPKDFFVYQHEIKTKRAVERNIVIIGEAMNRLLVEQKDIEVSNARKIVDARNRIVHGYDSVSDRVIWGIINKHLPVLKLETEQLLKE